MPSIYARSPQGGGSVYSRRGRSGMVAPPQPPKKKRHGILGALSQGLGDLETAAVNSPAGIYQVGKATSHDTAAVFGHIPGASPYARKAASEPSQLKPIGAATVQGLAQDVRHPLRHPGFTALDVLALASLGAGTVARGAAVAGRVGEGARASEIASAALRAPKPGVRVLRAGPLEVSKPASRSALTRSVVRKVDALRNRFPDAHLLVQSQYTRVGKIIDKRRTHDYRLLTTPFEELKVAGRRIHPNSPRGMAMRAVAQGTPLETVIQTATRDLAAATDKFTRKQLRREIRIALDARKYVNNETLPGGEVVPRLGDPKLQALYDQAHAASKLEDERMLASGQITPEQIQTGIQGPGRIYAGAQFVEPTGARLGVPSVTLVRQQAEVARLQKLFDRSVAREAKAPKRSMVHRFDEPAGPKVSEAELKQRIADRQSAVSELRATIHAERSTTGPHDRLVSWLETRYPHYDDAEIEAKISELARGKPGVAADLNETASTWLSRTEGNEATGLPGPGAAAAERSGSAFRQSRNERLRAIKTLRAEISGLQKQLAAKAGGLAPAGSSAARSSLSERLGGALSVQKEKLARMEAAAASRVEPTGLVGAEDFSQGQFHVGQQTRRSAFSVNKPPVIGNARTVGIPRTPGRLTHALTGASIHHGGLRHDVPALVADNALESERHAALLRARDFFIEHAQDVPAGIKHPVPIRLDELKNTPFPEPVKAMQDAYRAGGSLDQAQTSLLGMTYDTLRGRVFPKPEELGFPQVVNADIPAVPGVKWIDERLLGGLNRPRPLATVTENLPRTIGFIDAANNAVKIGILYLKPAYATPNMLGNLFLNLTQQGVFAPVNIGRSVKLARAIGPENARLVDRLMGEGISSVLSGPEGQGIVSRATQVGSALWSKPVDVPFRRASFLFEARKAGYGDAAALKRLLHDEAHAEELRTVTERATRAIIDYGDLSPVEQDIIRRLIFFYPWLKGSTRYAKDYLLEHPQQAALLGQAGKQGKQAQQAQLGPVPPFAEGLFKVGQRGGLPLVSNPTAAGILGQPADLAAIVQAALSGQVPRGREVSSLLTPFFGAGQTALSGYDSFSGRPVQPNLRTFLHELTAGQPIPTLVSRLRHDQSQRLFPLSKRDALLQFLLGGLAPRPVNEAKLRASAEKAYGPRR